MPLSHDLARHRRALTKAWLRWRVPFVVVVVAVGLAVGGWYGWQIYVKSAAASAARAREAAIRSVGQKVSAGVQARISSALKGFDLSKLAALVSARDRGAIAEAEHRLAASKAGILRVWLLPTNVERTDYSTTPPLSYASLDILRRSETSGKSPVPEVDLFGEPGQHIAVERRLTGAGGKLVGHLLVALDVKLLGPILASSTAPGLFTELQQRVSKAKPLVLARAGDRSLAAGHPAARLRVGGTAWQVVIWEATASASPGGVTLGALPLPLIGGAAAVLVLGLVAVVIVRRRRGAAQPEAPVAEEPSAAQIAAAVEAGAAAGAAGAGAEIPAVEVHEPGAGEGAPVELSATIFRAYDVRGVVGNTLTPAVVREIGRAIGSEAYDRGQQTLVVGRDGRNSSPDIATALIDGLRASGRDVIDIGRVPTPVLYFATHYMNTGSGVMVTGSHNPPSYNGLKIMLGGDTLFGDAIQGLRRRIVDGELASGEGGLQHMEVIDEYVRRVTEDVPTALGTTYKIVVDCGNGVAGEVAPKLYRALGHDIVELYCDVDGNFPNHHPDPSQPENLADLIAAVRDNGADLGLAFDGDGDRLGIVDASGRILWPDLQMMLFARDVLARKAGAPIIFDVKCTAFLPRVIHKLGGKPIMWKTGHSFIKSKLKETGAPLAGEMSGHIFFQDRWYGFDDALYAGARMLELLMAIGKRPADVFSKLPTGVTTPELRVDVAEGKQIELMAKLAAAGGFEGGKVTRIDGVRVDYKDGWGLVRASNTTPSLVLRFEGASKEALGRIQGQFKQALLALQPDLSLPF